MATPHPQTLKVLENFLDSSPLGKYILGRSFIHQSFRFLLALSRVGLGLTILIVCIPVVLLFGVTLIINLAFFSMMIAAFYLLSVSLLLQYHFSVPLYFGIKLLLPLFGYYLKEMQVIRYVTREVNSLMVVAHFLNHHLGVYVFGLLQRLAIPGGIILGLCIGNLYKILPILNSSIVKIFYATPAVDKLPITLTEYKNLQAFTLHYYTLHGGVGPTQSLAQFAEGLIDELEKQQQYAELQTLLRMGAFYTDFSAPALQYYQANYLGIIFPPIIQQLIALRDSTDSYLRVLPSDLSVHLTGRFVAYKDYPLAHWMLDEIKTPEGSVPVVAPTA